MWFLLKNISKIQQKILTVTGTLIIVDLSWTGRKRIPQFASRISSRIFDASKPSDSCDKLSHPWCCRRGILSSKDIWVHLRTPDETGLSENEAETFSEILSKTRLIVPLNQSWEININPWMLAPSFQTNFIMNSSFESVISHVFPGQPWGVKSANRKISRT